jgi:hypothetical protein
MEKLSLIVYSHSDYSDTWGVAINRIIKFSNFKIKYFSSDVPQEISTDFINITYNDILLYNKRLLSTLEKIKTEYVILLHEDMFLYDKIDNNNINKCIDLLDIDIKFDYVRLLKSGIKSNIHYVDNFFKIDVNDFLFSITPTIWRTNFLINMCQISEPKNIWDFETWSDSYLRNHGVIGFYQYNNERIRGNSHFDSKLFPHMSSGIFKGKWNMEYKDELEILFLENNIDKNIRGTIF